MKVRLADNSFINDSIVDGPGIRFTIFFQGCSIGCKGCFNPQTHSFLKGKLYNIEKIKEIIYKNRHLKRGITLSGGNPLEQPQAVVEISRYAHSINLDVWCYTGFKYEQIARKETTLKHIDVLVDGKFVEEKKNLLLKFRGSFNQRLIDVQKSLILKNIIELK